METQATNQTTNPNFEQLSKFGQILNLIDQIRTVFTNHFDRSWFAMVIDGLPVDFHTMREIRTLLSLNSIHPGDEGLVIQGVRELEQFCSHIRMYVLPVIKEKLGLSPFVREKPSWNENQYLIRKFVLYTFPYNLTTLENLTRRLKGLVADGPTTPSTKFEDLNAVGRAG